MRFFAIFICAFLFANDTLEINALNLTADEKNGIITLENEVFIKKGSDELRAPKVVVNIDKNRNPTQYSALGGVQFSILTQDKRKLNGRANEVHYDAKSGEYRLLGNSEVREENKINVIVGEEIILNKEKGYANITGTAKKPAKLIFKMENNNDK